MRLPAPRACWPRPTEGRAITAVQAEGQRNLCQVYHGNGVHHETPGRMQPALFGTGLLAADQVTRPPAPRPPWPRPTDSRDFLGMEADRMSINCPPSARTIGRQQAARILGVSLDTLSSLPLRVFDLAEMGPQYRMDDVLEYEAASTPASNASSTDR